MVFKSKKDKFAVALHEMAENLKESADYFAEYKIREISDLKIFSDKMKEYEHRGDDIVHGINTELNNTFITPIEREDIMFLTNSMDDVLDGLEECAALFEMYSIVNIDKYMLDFVKNIRECTYEITRAVELLTLKKLKDMRDHAINIKRIESNCDELERQSIKKLFEIEKDPIRIIQYKEIYESFEEIADHCEKVANTLEAIIMKNA
ncbi:DUF47 domain-containing protein [Oceanobacillus chungangensis]|uniref:DUF47 domain-containing protein n=1 Tax=Oceanobacillus chungangensis TaxID=1229152 RepID=A0A3D8PPS8_9BACI|nr:DUF47 domain-containing protein [Oceanobacillus chungangensis]RDW17258.1 DUF47 domain-containing protein [Oceanobacillus chungangensis]